MSLYQSQQALTHRESPQTETPTGRLPTPVWTPDAAPGSSSRTRDPGPTAGSSPFISLPPGVDMQAAMSLLSILQVNSGNQTPGPFVGTNDRNGGMAATEYPEVSSGTTNSSSPALLGRTRGVAGGMGASHGQGVPLSPAWGPGTIDSANAAVGHQEALRTTSRGERHAMADGEHDVRSGAGGSQDGESGVLTAAEKAEVKRLAKAQAEQMVKKALAGLERQYKRSRTKGGKVPNILVRAVQHEMYALMGLERALGSQRKKLHVALPNPLAPGVEARYAPDGKTRWYNPEWDARVDVGVNLEFITAVRDLIREKGGIKHELPSELTENDELIIKAAHTYFRSLRRRYHADHSEEAKAKYEKKLQVDKHYQRRRRRTNILREGMQPFRKVFGRGATEGVEELVISPWQSSEDSGNGDGDQQTRDEERRKAGAGRHALELRTLRWKSRKMRMLYLILAVFGRFQAERGDELDEESTEDFTPAEHDTYLEELRAAVRTWRSITINRNQQFDRFRGPAVNALDLPREDKHRRPIYKECISRKWAKETNEHTQLYKAAGPCPSTFTIFDLELPMDLLPELDQEWMEKVETTDFDEIDDEELA
ncbi:hypothetical protein C2E23DRAFT_859624 [Lenzites betulinus]|nr:hypothetical protein C2E23DRAFT_859624 [Lenzites betulinus]